jgi:cytochrome c biogenesis protein CcmG, thiol:disulfide interchange protein DsbE
MPARAALLAVLVLAVAVGAAAAPRPLDDLMMDMQIAPLGPREAPPLSVTTLDGARVSLADVRGHVVLVYFWATW